MPQEGDVSASEGAPAAKRARRLVGGVAPPPGRSELGTNAPETNAGDDEDARENDDDETDGRNAAHENRAHAANTDFLPRSKALPLNAEDIPLLNVAQRRAILSRWNSRLRALKNRARDIAYQFPTANVSVFLSKPFPTERRHRWWAEEEFLALGPMTRVAREYRVDGEVKLLSGAQILRRTYADVTDVTMNEKEQKVDALPSNENGDVVAPRRDDVGGVDASTTARASDASAKTVDGLFRRLMPLVPVELHSRLAHDLVTSGFVLRTGAAPGGALLKKFKEYEADKKGSSATQGIGQEYVGEDASRTEEERRLIATTLRAYREMNAADGESRF